MRRRRACRRRRRHARRRSATVSGRGGPRALPVELAHPAEQAEDAGDVAARLRVRRHAHAAGHGSRAGVVGRERERDGREAPQQVAHQVRLGVDRLRGVERVVETERRGRARHELRDALRARRALGERVEVALRVQLRGEQRRGDVPALRRAREQRRVAVGHERRQRALVAAVARARARRRARVQRVPVVPRLPRVPLDEVEPRRVGGQPGVRGRRAEVELGGVAVQRRARRRHPLRVRVAARTARPARRPTGRRS